MRTLAEVLSAQQWGGSESTSPYSGYVCEAKDKPPANGAESGAKGRMSTMDTNASTNANAQDSTLSQYEGPIQSSPMYKSMYNTQVQDTTQAYNNARAKRSTQARMAGFGTTSPIAGTDSATVDSLEAGDIGRTGTDVMTKLMPMQMEAAGMRGSNIATDTNAGTNSMNTWQTAENQRNTRRAAMWNNLAKLGVQGATLGMAGAGMKVPGVSQD